MTPPIIKLALANLLHRPLGTALTVATLAAAAALISLILQFGGHAEDRLEKDLAGVDLVVGAKGSPLQLILSSLLHMDIPTGNIPLREAQTIMRDRQVADAVPLALGDSFRSFRIVGTTPDFLSLYKAELGSGDIWTKPQQVVIGAAVHKGLGMNLGQKFVGGHGLSTSGTGLAEHAHAPFEVTGILQPTGSIVDRLILTSVDSVWLVHDIKPHDDRDEHGAHHEEDHEGHEDHNHDGHEEHDDEHEHDEHLLTSLADIKTINPGDREVTALLVKYSSPIAAVRLPRAINAKTGLQAAAPAIEITRLFNLSSGIADAARAVAFLLTLIGGLSIFVAVSNASAAGLYDVALMRAMGASPVMVMTQRLFEGALIAAVAGLLGIALAHLTVFAVQLIYSSFAVFGLTGGQLFPSEHYLLIGMVFIGAIAALWPAFTCYRISPSLLLQRGR